MKAGTLVDTSTGSLHTALPQVWKAASAWERTRGLLGRPALDWGQALWIESCSSVHTVGMRYPLDLAFIDASGRVQKLVRHVRPWRAAMAWGARATLEMRSGQLDRCALRVGSVVRWQEQP